MVYARARAGDGDVAEYLELAAANQRTALEIGDVVLQANAWAYLADALGFASRLEESIRMAEETLARFPGNIPADEWVIGIHPHAWAALWTGWSLCWAGRLQEGFEEFARSRRLADELKAEWFAVYVETPGTDRLSQENREFVWRDMRLAERLGATVHFASLFVRQGGLIAVHDCYVARTELLDVIDIITQTDDYLEAYDWSDGGKGLIVFQKNVDHSSDWRHVWRH